MLLNLSNGRRLTARLALLTTLLSFGACAKAVLPDPDKNTNWLKPCATSKDCGSTLSCTCGACTKACTNDTSCSGVGSAAECKPISQVAQGGRCEASLASAAGAICVVAHASQTDAGVQKDAQVRRSDAALPSPAADAAVPRCGDGIVQAGESCDGPALHAQCNACIITCDSGFGDCDANAANGCEADLSSDSNACGACGNACGTGAPCGSGICTTVLASGQASISDLAVDSTYAYWTTFGTQDPLGNWRKDGTVARVALTGGTAEVLVPGLERPAELAVDSTNAYFVTGQAVPVIETVALSGGAATPLVTRPNFKGRLALDDTYLYWTEVAASSGSIVYRMRKDGSAGAEPLLTSTESVWSRNIAANATHICWFTDLGFRCADKDGKNLNNLVTIPSPALQPSEFLVLDGATAYWGGLATSTTTTGGYSTVLYSISLSGGDVTRLALEEGGQGIGGLAIDNDKLYWTYTTGNNDEVAFLVVTDKTPGTSRTLLSSNKLKRPLIAVTGNLIVLATIDSSGMILTYPKP